MTANDRSVGSEATLNGALAGGVGASPGGHQRCAGGRERTLSRRREARVSDRRLTVPGEGY